MHCGLPRDMIRFEIRTRVSLATVRLLARDLNQETRWDTTVPPVWRHDALLRLLCGELSMSVERDTPEELRLRATAATASIDEVFHFITCGRVNTIMYAMDFALFGWRWLLTPVIALRLRWRAQAQRSMLSAWLMAAEETDTILH